MKDKDMNPCPCGKKESLENCCLPLIRGEKEASTPEELMRSRYTAFYLKNMDYVKETTDPQTQSEFDFAGNQEWANAVQFTKLEILSASEDGNKGIVEFKAHFTAKTEAQEEQSLTHHEISKFRKQQGLWYFRDGKVLK